MKQKKIFRGRRRYWPLVLGTSNFWRCKVSLVGIAVYRRSMDAYSRRWSERNWSEKAIKIQTGICRYRIRRSEWVFKFSSNKSKFDEKSTNFLEFFDIWIEICVQKEIFGPEADQMTSFLLCSDWLLKCIGQSLNE